MLTTPPPPDKKKAMIYKYQHNPISKAHRSGGSKSAVACAAYRAGEKITDPATGKIYDYTKKSGILHSAIIVPEGEAKIPRAELWAAADAAEKRRDARVAREIVGALDPDLTLADNIALVQRHAHRLADKYGCAVDYAIHAPSRSGDQRNLHVHFMLTTRRMEDGKLTQKTDLEQNDKALAKAGKPSGRAQIKTLREDWQNDINAALERAGKKYRVDARSYQDQGLDIMPGIHLGPEATRAERRGERTERGDYNRLVEAINVAQAELERREKEAQRRAEKPPPVEATEPPSAPAAPQPDERLVAEEQWQQAQATAPPPADLDEAMRRARRAASITYHADMARRGEPAAPVGTAKENAILEAAADAAAEAWFAARRQAQAQERPQAAAKPQEPPQQPQAPPQQTQKEPSAYKADGMTLEERRRAEHAATLAAAGLDKRKPAPATKERGGRGG